MKNMTGKRKMTVRNTSGVTDERQPSYVKYKFSIRDMENADKPNRGSDGKRHADRSRSAGGKRWGAVGRRRGKAQPRRAQ